MSLMLAIVMSDEKTPLILLNNLIVLLFVFYCVYIVTLIFFTLFITGTYDLIIGVGALLPSHINEDAFEEMIRITKPGMCSFEVH